ncbi:MAG: glycosyltransferase family 2 protein [Bacillota bacterium]
MIVFSIIIPIYNGEKYLRKCLDSIVNISYKDKEIILVNDGSTDSSAKIAKEYADRYDYMKLINKKNGGVASARNKGLDESTGKYIIFVDSDDTVNDNMSVFMQEIKDINAQFAMGKFIDFSNEKSITRGENKFLKDKKLQNVDDELKSMILHYTDGINPIWNKAFLKKFLINNNIRFRNYSVGEDTDFVLKCLFHIKTFYYTTTKWYTYKRFREDSLINSPKEKNIDIIISCSNDNLNYTNKHIKNKKLKNSIKIFLSLRLMGALKHYCDFLDKKRIIEKYKKNVNIMHYDNNNLKYKLIYIFIKVFGWGVFLKILNIYFRLKKKYLIIKCNIPFFHNIFIR